MTIDRVFEEDEQLLKFFDEEGIRPGESDACWSPWRPTGGRLPPIGERSVVMGTQVAQSNLGEPRDVDSPPSACATTANPPRCRLILTMEPLVLRGTRGPLRVLVVEDDPTLGRFDPARAGPAHRDVTVVRTGAAALAALSRTALRRHRL